MDYQTHGNHAVDFVPYAQKMKKLGVDLVDVSSGGVVPTQIKVYPGYQVSFSENIRNNAKICTSAVGLITQPEHAEEILQNERADLVFLGRVLLRDPYWPIRASRELGDLVELPKPYERSYAKKRTDDKENEK